MCTTRHVKASNAGHRDSDPHSGKRTRAGYQKPLQRVSYIATRSYFSRGLHSPSLQISWFYTVYRTLPLGRASSIGVIDSDDNQGSLSVLIEPGWSEPLNRYWLLYNHILFEPSYEMYVHIHRYNKLYWSQT